jgi:hypothetical protein
MGALADDIEVQLRHQCLSLGSRSDADRIQRWANEISSLGIHGLLTEAERDRARKRLMKEIRLLVRPLPAHALPLPEVGE